VSLIMLRRQGVSTQLTLESLLAMDADGDGQVTEGACWH
jgi:hypothetical protein